MSAPGLEFREAEYLGLGFLAISASELLDQLLTGGQLDDDDKYTLNRAKRFLEDASSGAELVKSGIGSTVNAVDSVRCLSYSVEPLKVMRQKIKTSEVDTAFRTLAGSIGDAVDHAKIDRSELTVAKDFFKQLHFFFVELAERNKRKTGLCDAFGASLMLHA
jgi:hypothetical protein